MKSIPIPPNATPASHVATIPTCKTAPRNLFIQNLHIKILVYRCIYPANLFCFGVRAFRHKPIDYVGNFPVRFVEGGFPTPAKVDPHIRKIQDEFAFLLENVVIFVLRLKDLFLGFHDVVILCASPLIIANIEVVTALEGGTGSGRFGDGLGLSGDYGRFSRLDFEVLIVGGGRIRGEHSTSWIGDTKCEVEELNEAEKERAVAQHRA